MKDMPLVSVITPTYNRPDYLKQAIASALGQTYGNIELIVSDNCSPQNPQALIEAFADSRIRFFRHDRNLGLIANFLYATHQAQGKYIAYLMDDDLWEPEFLEKLVSPLEAHPELVLAFCDHSIINAAGEIDEPETEKFSHQYKRSDLTEGIYQPFMELAIVDAAVSSAVAAVMRRDVINGQQIPEELGGCVDLYLSYLYSREGQGAYYYPAKLTRYRCHDLGDTTNTGKRNTLGKINQAKAEVFCYQRFLEDDRLKPFHPLFQKKLAHWMTTLGIGLMRSQKNNDARPYIWQSLTQRFNFRTAVALLLSYSPSTLARRF
jgi:glycosyltransferase involved in cell wall biosynthesis